MEELRNTDVKGESFILMKDYPLYHLKKGNEEITIYPSDDVLMYDGDNSELSNRVYELNNSSHQFKNEASLEELYEKLLKFYSRLSDSVESLKVNSFLNYEFSLLKQDNSYLICLSIRDRENMLMSSIRRVEGTTYKITGNNSLSTALITLNQFIREIQESDIEALYDRLIKNKNIMKRILKIKRTSDSSRNKSKSKLTINGRIYDSSVKRTYSKKQLLENPPSWAKKGSLPLWREAVNKATHEGEKEVNVIVPISLYKKALSSADYPDFVSDSYDFIRDWELPNSKLQLFEEPQEDGTFDYFLKHITSEGETNAYFRQEDGYFRIELGAGDLASDLKEKNSGDDCIEQDQIIDLIDLLANYIISRDITIDSIADSEYYHSINKVKASRKIIFKVKDDSGEEQFDRGVKAAKQAKDKGWDKSQTMEYYDELHKQFNKGLEEGFKD